MTNEKENLSKSKPFVINIFCADGDPDGIRIINKSNWSGQGLIFPKELFQDAKELFRDAKGNYDQSVFSAPGIYVLMGHPNNGSEINKMNLDDISEADENPIEIMENAEEDTEYEDFELLYIGEGDPVGDRLNVHYSDKAKNFWESCIFFVGKDLNKAHIQHLEASLLKIAKDAPMVKLVNKNDPTFPNLTLPEKAIAEGFLDEMLSIFPIVGIDAFQKIKPKNLLYIIKQSKGISAKGFKKDNGFIVLKGSIADLFGANLPRSLKKLKERLLDEGTLKIEDNHHIVFMKDYLFHNPAKAASLILGYQGAQALWKYQDGTSLCKPKLLEIEGESISEETPLQDKAD